MSIASWAQVGYSTVWVNFGIAVGTCYVAIQMRDYFAPFCAIMGSMVTTLNSVILPIIFFHSLSTRPVSTAIFAMHVVMIIVASTAAIITAGDSICHMNRSHSQFCDFITLSN
jgi:xanthosine utilization system XapX-like protein